VPKTKTRRHQTCLEDTEELLDVEGLVGARSVLNDVESDGLGQWPALADGHEITLANVLEAGGAVDRDVSVSLLETSVLGHVLEVISAHDDGSLHLVGDDHGLQDTATDGHVSGEGALLVNVVTVGSLDRGLEAKADGLGVSHALLGGNGAGASDEDGILLLVSLLNLVCFLVGAHDCVFSLL